MQIFKPINQKLFFKNTKENDPRLGEYVQPLQASEILENSYIISGYPDDEGIALNQGRLGAALAPDMIRHYLYKMSCAFNSSAPHLLDNGNINPDLELKDKHEKPVSLISQRLLQGAKWISLGGGHDFAYPDGCAFVDYCAEKKLKPLVLNFDAHLDVRSTSQGLSSGTPFYRLLEKYPQIKLLELGIQSQCNSQAHFDWCKNRGVEILTYDDLLVSERDHDKRVIDFILPHITESTAVFLSIDIDGFAACHAMGCSQSWATGFEPNSFLRLISKLKNLTQIPIIGIYEVSPPLDSDNRTSKLAAQLIHRYIFQ